jgi:hypothetical protein
MFTYADYLKLCEDVSEKYKAQCFPFNTFQCHRWLLFFKRKVVVSNAMDIVAENGLENVHLKLRKNAAQNMANSYLTGF